MGFLFVYINIHWYIYKSKWFFFKSFCMYIHVPMYTYTYIHVYLHIYAMTHFDMCHDRCIGVDSFICVP